MGANNFIKFKAGELIFAEGDPANCAYIIDKGVIGLYPGDTKSTLFATVQEGELLGEMGVIDESPRSIGAYAETDVELIVVDSDQISMRLQHSDPIIHSLMEVLLKRVRGMINPSMKSSPKKETINNNAISKGMHKIRLENDLTTAIENDELVNVYQPIINLSDGTVAGFEALCRWNHAEKGMISPFEFVTLAEETDLIRSMGIIIFDKACSQLAKFQEAVKHEYKNKRKLFMSINVSSAQLSEDDFFNKIKAITEKYQVKPIDIKIELTESLMVDYELIKSWLKNCHDLGFQLSLDDFGTGYSGFQHLVELNFQTIKIDQSFTRTMGSNPKSLIVLEMIAAMAKKMDMSIVAEGIEDVDSIKVLKSLGIDYGQGYYFSKPVNEIEAMKGLKNNP